ncbi:MAG: antibiotic biosynthesis monooxygenase [Salinisphaera sp.]|nr:antibiotic biosynthesis monooxygenase [Salinisphaera sp.]
MVIVLGTITAASEREAERVQSALVARARKSRSDDGNLEYAFSRSLEDAKEFRLTERWESDAHLSRHLEVPDPEFAELMATAGITAATVKVYDGANERLLMNRK